MAKPKIELGLAIMQATRERGPYTFQEIANYCDCSRERIRQIYERALKKIRLRLEPETFEQLKHHVLSQGQPQAYRMPFRGHKPNGVQS